MLQHIYDLLVCWKPFTDTGKESPAPKTKTRHTDRDRYKYWFQFWRRFGFFIYLLPLPPSHPLPSFMKENITPGCKTSRLQRVVHHLYINFTVGCNRNEWKYHHKEKSYNNMYNIYKHVCVCVNSVYACCSVCCVNNNSFFCCRCKREYQQREANRRVRNGMAEHKMFDASDIWPHIPSQPLWKLSGYYYLFDLKNTCVSIDRPLQMCLLFHVSTGSTFTIYRVSSTAYKSAMISVSDPITEVSSMSNVVIVPYYSYVQKWWHESARLSLS